MVQSLEAGPGKCRVFKGLSFARKGVYVIIILRVIPPKLTNTREGHSMVASSICLGIFMNIVTAASRHYQYCLCQLLFPA